MIRKDFLLQLVERAGPFLKRLFALRQAERKEDARAVLEEACRALLNLDARMVLALPTPSLKGLLCIDEGQGPARCRVAADLLGAYADCLEAAGAAAEAAACRLKAGELTAAV